MLVVQSVQAMFIKSTVILINLNIIIEFLVGKANLKNNLLLQLMICWTPVLEMEG